MRGIDLQMAFSLNKQADMSTAIAANKIDRVLPYRTFAPAVQEFPDAISDKDWYGKGHSFASFWDPITKQVTLPSREYSLSNLSALFAPAFVMGNLVSIQPYSGASPSVYDHKFTFMDPASNPNCLFTSVIEKMGGIYQNLISGVVVEQFTLTGNRNDHVTVAWQGFGRKMAADVTSMPNLSTQSFFKTVKGEFRFGAAGAQIVVSTKILSFNLTATQNPSKFYMPGQSAGEESLLAKALVGKQGISGQIVILLEDNTQRALFLNNSECALTITLWGDQIGATSQYYCVLLDIPHLKIPSETFGEEQDQVSYTIPFTEQSVLKATGSDYFAMTVRCDENASKLLVAG